MQIILNRIKLISNVSCLLLFVISICLFSIYYYCTTAANYFGLDQYKLIEYSKDILEGNFKLVGMRTSRLNWNFPMIHYLLTPLAAITINPLIFYFSTAANFILMVLNNKIITKRIFKELLKNRILVVVEKNIPHYKNVIKFTVGPEFLMRKVVKAIDRVI